MISVVDQNGSTATRPCFRERQPLGDIQPEMRFSLKSYIKSKAPEERSENKGHRTFVSAMQTFYNKLNMSNQIHEESAHNLQHSSPARTSKIG